MKTKTFITTKLAIMAILASFVIGFAFTPLQQAHALSLSEQSSGASISEMQAQIADLLELVKRLQKQLAEIKNESYQIIIDCSEPQPTTDGPESVAWHAKCSGANDDDEKGVTKGNGCGYEFTRTLGRGSIHKDVKDLQKVLHEEGYYEGTEFTHFFGPLTEAAVQAFQTAEGIVSSGSPE